MKENYHKEKKEKTADMRQQVKTNPLENCIFIMQS